MKFTWSGFKSCLISFRHVQDGRTLISNTSTQFLNETFSYPCYGTKEKSEVDFTMCVYSLEKPALPLTLASDVARYINSSLHSSWYDTTTERLAIFCQACSLFRNYPLHHLGSIRFFFEISLPIGKGTVNFFSLLTAAYFMLSLVRIWTTLRLAWPRFVFVMQLLAQLFTFLLTLLHIPGHVLSFFMELV